MTPELKAKIEAAKARSQKTLAAAKEKQDVSTVPQPERARNIPEVAGNDGHANPAPVVEPLVVVTEVQPAALVVVEQPAERELGSRGTQDGEQRSDGSDGPSTELDLSNPVHAGFLQRLEDLETALLARDPMMPTHLAEIHKTLMQYDDIMPLLSVEEISKIMAAQQTHVALFLRQEVVKGSKASAVKKTAKVTLDDI